MKKNVPYGNEIVFKPATVKKMVTNETADHNGTLDLDLHQRIQNSIFELVYM
jgi:hypothetical protein